MSTKKEFGDFQTPDGLSLDVVRLVDSIFGSPEVVVEPTAGIGGFLKASAMHWGKGPKYVGYEVNSEYVKFAQQNLKPVKAEVLQRDFFSEDWVFNLNQYDRERVLVIGNPPWVTNSDLGQLQSKNLPRKANFQGMRGLDARTGKSNFDIAEWMLIRLFESLPPSGAIAMLCKTMTARKVLRHLWKSEGGREKSFLFRIDAKSHFDVSVDACLFFALGQTASQCSAQVFDDLDINSNSTKFGFVNNELVSDMEKYEKLKFLRGGPSTYTWRSGLKHDASKIMEFTRSDSTLVNGFGEIVDLESDFLFPLLKSSDIGNGRTNPRKSVLVTQRHTGESTAIIKAVAPKTWKYLSKYESQLKGRKSSIYKNRPLFSVFGVGPYSFAPWKVAVSGLYKRIEFVVIPPEMERPVMVDDTCYTLACSSQAEAELVCSLLSSKESVSFLNSLIFKDSKRPITIDVLRNISIVELARHHNRLDELVALAGRKILCERDTVQLSLL